MTTATIASESTASFSARASFVPSFSGFCDGERDEHERESFHRDQPRTFHPEVEEMGFSRAEAYRAALLGRPV